MFEKAISVPIGRYSHYLPSIDFASINLFLPFPVQVKIKPGRRFRLPGFIAFLLITY